MPSVAHLSDPIQNAIMGSLLAIAALAPSSNHWERSALGLLSRWGRYWSRIGNRICRIWDISASMQKVGELRDQGSSLAGWAYGALLDAGPPAIRPVDIRVAPGPGAARGVVPRPQAQFPRGPVHRHLVAQSNVCPWPFHPGDVNVGIFAFSRVDFKQQSFRNFWWCGYGCFWCLMHPTPSAASFNVRSEEHTS